jgi:hypothetical protein
MIDVSLKGVRCRAANEILDIDGTIGASTEGTIVYELEGEGGQLINVCWDDGTRSLVSSDEIIITEPLDDHFCAMRVFLPKISVSARAPKNQLQ